MSRILFIGAALLIWGCSPVPKTVKSSAVMARDSLDSTEYEVVVIDPGFDQWYMLNYSPALDHSDDYYRTQNLIAVGNWNEYYRSGEYPEVVACFIDYRPEVNYGLEVNRKLFWYFKYVKTNYRIRLY